MFEGLMPFIIFKALLGFALPLAFAVRELMVLNRLKREREAKVDMPVAAATSAPELTPAVIARSEPVRERELEPA